MLHDLAALIDQALDFSEVIGKIKEPNNVSRHPLSRRSE